MPQIQSNLWHKQIMTFTNAHLLSVSSLLRLSGMLSLMIWWVGDVLGLIFCDKVKREKGLERAEMAAIDNW